MNFSDPTYEATRKALQELESAQFNDEANKNLEELIQQIFHYEETIDGEWGACWSSERIRESARLGSESIPALIKLAALIRALRSADQ